MLRWSRFKGECDKGQFFVISIVIIVISLTSMVSFFDVYDEIRLSDFHRYQEDGIFRSVTEGVEETVDSSECGIDDQPRKRNLLDFRKTVVEDASPRDVYINITYREFCGYYNQTVTAIDVKSPGFSMHHAFEAMPKEHEYELTVNIEGGGSVEVDGDKYDDEYTGTYTEGTDVELQAIPDTEWVFDEWTGDCFGEDPDDCEVTMNQDREVTAHFEEIEDPDEYTLTVDEPDGEGTVEVDGDEIGENEYPYTEDFTDGEEVNLYADPDDGWEFVEWTGDKESYDEEITITMDEDKEAKAYFEELEEYELTIDVDPGEGGDTDPETGTYTYYEGTEVTVEAISEFGWQFDYWEGDCDYEVGNECTVGMDGDKSVTAHFEEDENGISECEAMGYECVPSGYCLGQTLVYECPSNQECCDEDPGIIP